MLYSLAGVGQMQAQESSCTLVLSGHVIDDHDKEALPFAEVYLAELDRGAQADSAGRFTIAGLCAGT